MKKIFALAALSLLTLAGCGSLEQTPSEVNAAEMAAFLRSGRNNFTPNMEAVTSMMESGEFSESDDLLIAYYCTYNYLGTTENEDGSYSQSYKYYEYDYDYYSRAQELIMNGIDDDEDGLIDEDDELLLMVTDEMTDGIDNNHNGLTDEYFEMTPKYVVTYTVTWAQSMTTTVSEDGTITTTGSYFGEWSEEKVLYTGQVIEFEACYEYEPEDSDEDSVQSRS
jgi:predicted small lipoprotein YifL